MKKRTRQRGFTLVEAVIVISITAIVGAMVAVFIRMPVQGYIDSAVRADMADVGDTALRRMARDVRLSLPNSIRISGNYMELLLTKSGGRYLAVEDEQPTGGIPLQFAQAGNCTTTPNLCRFQVVGPMPGTLAPVSLRQQIAANDFIVVYNLGPGIEPANAYDCTGICNRATVASVAGNVVTLTASAGSTAFAQQTAAETMTSPSRRFQAVSGPVTYFCDPRPGTGNLYRYEGYGITSAQPTIATLPLANRSIVASNVVGCGFTANVQPNVRASLINLRLELSDSTGVERMDLFQQINVNNTP
ncbi:MAG TPA: type II secretion system protein [Burkholderiaceae bacterium]